MYFQKLISCGAFAGLVLMGTPAAAQSDQYPSPAAQYHAAAAAPAFTAAMQPNYRIQESLRSKALKWELGYLALSAVDAAQTIQCLNRGICSEANPLFGKKPSATKLILAKAGLGLIHFGVFKHTLNRNPKAALRMAQISAGVQGSVVTLNARFTFK